MYGPSECGSPAVQWRSREKIFHHNSLAALSGCSNISGDIYKPGMIVMCQLCEILIPQPAGLQYNTTACCDHHTPTTILQADRAGLVSLVVGCCCCCRFCLFISISSNWKFSISIELLIAGEEGADSRLTWPRTPVDSVITASQHSLSSSPWRRAASAPVRGSCWSSWCWWGSPPPSSSSPSISIYKIKSFSRDSGKFGPLVNRDKLFS